MTPQLLKGALAQSTASVSQLAATDAINNDYAGAALGPMIQMFVMEIFNFGKSNQEMSANTEQTLKNIPTRES